MEDEQQPGLLQRMLEARSEWAAEQPSLGAELKAMAREAAKDVRSTIMEAFLGSPELGGEPGTPLNPTPQMVTQDLGTVHGSYREMLDMAASRGAAEPPEKGRER